MAIERAIKREATITIVGAGRMGTALARALAPRGYLIEAMVARSKSHARRAAELTNAQPRVLTKKQLDQIPASDILLITTPDDAIESSAEKISATLQLRRAKLKQTAKSSRSKKEARRPVALHTSGALSSNALRTLREVGFSVGSLHPLVSVSDPVQGAISLRSAFFCLEGDEEAVRVARKIVRALEAQSFSIEAKRKALYHAAAVMGSGHVTALFDIATEMLAACGLSERRAREILLPLVQSAIENLRTSDPAQALTGTFARADLSTVRRHLAALKSQKMTDARAAYVLLGRRSLRLAKEADVPSGALREIERILTAEDAEDTEE
jgi:predicted short-subunit dehydrogenase-like oxidoreductase (DUF2520 family)